MRNRVQDLRAEEKQRAGAGSQTNRDTGRAQKAQNPEPGAELVRCVRWYLYGVSMVLLWWFCVSALIYLVFKLYATVMPQLCTSDATDDRH
jgi:hypothetical protein